MTKQFASMIKFLILAILGVSKSRHYSLTIQWHQLYCWTLNPTYLPKNRYGLLKTDKTAFQLIRAKTKLARTRLCYPEEYSQEGAYLLTKNWESLVETKWISLVQPENLQTKRLYLRVLLLNLSPPLQFMDHKMLFEFNIWSSRQN